jgi:type I restriction enzyme M protein
LAEFVELQKIQAESENSWRVKISDIDQNTFDLSAKNPNAPIEPPEKQHHSFNACTSKCSPW